MNTKRLTKLIALVLCAVMCTAVFAGCTETETQKYTPDAALKGRHTYQTYTTLSPSNWNELTYQDSNDTQIMSYIGSSFFTYDFKFDAEGNILPGEFDVEYDAATSLVDVTSKYAEAWGLIAEYDEDGNPVYETKNLAYAITLRDDLKWENGDRITAADFVYSMQEQLNPLFQNYRADSYYNSAQSLVGAKDYAKQGQKGLFDASSVYALSDYSADLDSVLIWNMGPAIKDNADTTDVDETRPVSYVRAYFQSASYLSTTSTVEQAAAFLAANFGGDKATWVAMEGKTLAQIKADSAMNACFTAVLGWWQTEPGEEMHFCLADYTFPEYPWNDAEGKPQVGIFVGDNELELVIVLTKPLDLLKEDGSLSYKAAYNMSSLPLVHKATYEANKVEPEIDGGLWTSTYNSSVESTMSWGPYKLTEFQAGKYYVVERNNNWYGYNMDSNDGLYQTDRVYCETISEWNTAWLKFQAGEIEGIGIDVTIAADYKNSERAYYTPDDYVGSLQLQSSVESLKKRGDEEGVNKMLLAYPEFRQAISLAINRADYAEKCTTASLAGFGLFNSMHYNDVANGGVFRNTDDAKQVLCDVYGVDVSKYASLDDAVDSITGYNIDLARQLVTTAYNKALEAGDITDTDLVKFTFGTGAINENTERAYKFLSDSLKAMVVGTPLEGRFDTELKDFNTKWANDFRAGAYDICTGGWSGAAWDPGYFLLAYLDSGYMFSTSWDTKAEMMTFTMKGVGPNGEDIEETMSLYDWYLCLNGDPSAEYNWSSSALAESQRAQLIAALEKAVLTKYYSVPLTNSFSASLISYKIDYITYEYNTFMGYGGMKYMQYNFDDYDWAILLHDNNGKLNYK